MTHGSLFAGIGGFDLAARWAGIETIYQVENNPFCNKVLAKHFPNTLRFGDIKDVSSDDIPYTDVITGGFPCQPFSIAGKRQGNEDSRALWREMFRIIKDKHPAWIVGENVPNFVNMALESACIDMENEGYEVQPLIIPACGIGAPHLRNRVWIVAHSRCKHEPWNGNISEVCGKDQKGNADKSERASEILSDSHSTRCQELHPSNITNNERHITGQIAERWNNWETESKLGRVADGISNRVDRLRSIGNAIVPQVAFQLFKHIKDIDINERSKS